MKTDRLSCGCATVGGAANRVRHPAPRPVFEAGIPEGSPPSSWQSQDLLGVRKAVEIIHDGRVYRLQATRLGKLILTK